MPPYLNTEPNPQKPGAAEAIERLQVALRHLRAAKLALTDLSYAPACEALSGNEEVEYQLDSLTQATEYAVYSARGLVEALGGKPDMESHYSGRQQAEALDEAAKIMAAIPFIPLKEKMRQMAEMAWRMA